MKSACREHPCFSESAHFRFARIHLPVAPRCNIRCGYCDRRYDCPNESRPGVTSAVLTPEQALERLARYRAQEPRLRVAGIAGPGEPLANPETFETLRLIGRAFPELTLCISTNGLLLPDMLPELADCGVSTLTVTVNTLRQQTAEKIYLRSSARDYVPQLLEGQQRGIALAAEMGLAVKINTVLIPGINDGEVTELAYWAASVGAEMMNVMPLIPQAAFASHTAPDCAMLETLRTQAEGFLPQFRLCRQCRADAAGVPGGSC